MAFGKTKRQSTFDERELEYIQIDDFTPGIHSDYQANSGKGVFPEGAAQLTNTFSCIGAPNGGLIPAPRLISSYLEDTFDIGNYPTNDEAVHITDFRVVPTNVYPSVNTQQFFPSADKTITNFQTDGGATTNLFQIVSVNPLSTAHYIRSSSSAVQGSAVYQCNFGTGAYSNGGRAVTAVTFVIIGSGLNGLFADGLYTMNINTGGTASTFTTTSTQTNYQVLAVSLGANPHTGLPWTVSDIQAFASTNFFNFSTPSLGNPLEYSSVHIFQIYMFVSSGNTGTTPPFNDQAFYIFQWYNQNPVFVGPNLTSSFNQKTKVRTYKFWSTWNNSTPATNFDIANVITTSVIPDTTIFYGYTSLAVSRSNISTPTVPGNAIVASLVNPWVNDTGVYSALVYPKQSTPTVDSTDTLVITGTSAVKLCAHQDRIVAVINSGLQAFGTGGSIGFEEIRATATNNYSIDSGQDAIFVAENPSNIGALISVNANELIALKNQGGGYQARGDIGTSPTITRLPGLPPADINHRPISIPGGIVYGNSQGIWEFRSGDSATCLSDALDGRFWIPPNTSNYLSDVGCFSFLYPFIYIPNGFMYDIRTKAWWRINGNNNYAWSSSTTEGQLIYVPSSFTNGQSIADWYDPHQGQPYYSWQSQPFAITQTRLMELQEHTVIAQPWSSTVGGIVTLTYEGLQPNGQTYTQQDIITLQPSTAPQAFTNNMAIQGYDLTVRIECVSSDGVSPAPRFHRLNLGFAEAEKAAG